MREIKNASTNDSFGFLNRVVVASNELRKLKNIKSLTKIEDCEIDYTFSNCNSEKIYWNPENINWNSENFNWNSEKINWNQKIWIKIKKISIEIQNNVNKK